MSKSMQRKFEGRLVSAPVNMAMNTLFVDLLGSLVRSKKNNQYLLVATDGYSKYVWLTPI